MQLLGSEWGTTEPKHGFKGRRPRQHTQAARIIDDLLTRMSTGERRPREHALLAELKSWRAAHHP
jgi:hypothetical protein